MLHAETPLDVLTRRIDRLEAQARWMKLGLVAALALLMAGPLGIVRGAGIPELIEARRFVVKDGAGIVRGELGLDKAGKGGHFVVYGSDGNSMFETGEGLTSADDVAEPEGEDEEDAASSPIPGLASLTVRDDTVLIRPGDLRRGPALEGGESRVLKRGDTFVIHLGPEAGWTYTLTEIKNGEAVFKVKGGVWTGEKMLTSERELRVRSFGL